MTQDNPTHLCAVEGCHERAVARLLGDGGGYRCRDCALYDLNNRVLSNA